MTVLDKDTVTLIGATSVTVEQPSTSVSASRILDTTSVAAGGGPEVTIDHHRERYDSAEVVTETLPAGFSYVSSSPPADSQDENDITEDDDGQRDHPFVLAAVPTTLHLQVTVSQAGCDASASVLRGGPVLKGTM